MTNNMSSSTVGSRGTVASAPAKKPFKVDPPEKFTGKPGRLRGWLTEMRIYLLYNNESLPGQSDKVLAASTCLGGSAFDWFEPRVREYLESAPDERSAETDNMFRSYDYFTKELSKVFGDVDEKKTATRRLMQLKQTGSASTYTAEFRKQMSKLDWDDEALMAQYHQGLKPFLKQELLRKDEPDTLPELIELAVKIDNRFYEAKLSTGIQQPHPKKNKHHKKSYGDPMEIDQIKRSKDKQNKKKTLTDQ